MKRVTALFTLFILTILMFGLAHGQEDRQPDQQRVAAWQAFKDHQGEDWTIRWNQQTGLPRTIAHGKSKVYNGPAETAVRTFLTEQANLFGMKSNLSDLEHIRTTENRDGLRRITFQQYYQGIPIEGAEYKIHLFKEGRVGMANGFYYPDIEVSVSPSFSSSQAIEIAKTDLVLTKASGESNYAKLVVFPGHEGTFALAWKTLVLRKNLLPIGYIILMLTPETSLRSRIGSWM